MKDMAKVGEYSRVLVKAKSVPPKNRVKLDTGCNTQLIISPV